MGFDQTETSNVDTPKPDVSPQIVGKHDASESVSQPTPYDQETHLDRGNRMISVDTLEPFKPNLPHHSGRGGRRRKRGHLIPRTKENVRDKIDTIATEFPRNFIIKSPEDVNLSRIDTVTAHEELIQALNGKPKSITETRKGTLLVQTLSSQQSLNIMKITHLANTPVTVILNDYMNKTKGIINYDNLPAYSTQQLVEALEEFKVTEVYQIKKRNSNNNTTETSLYILTFNTLKLPENVQIGWTNCRVRPYIPRPRRCFKCHRYGHGAPNCWSPIAICANCGGADHGECNTSPKCINCSGDHPAFSAECQTYRYEEEIIATQIRENITFKEAKTIVSQRYVRPRRTFSEIVQQQPQTSETNSHVTMLQRREQTPATILPVEKSPPIIVTSHSKNAPLRDFHPNPTAFSNNRNRFALLTETENPQNYKEVSTSESNIEPSHQNSKKRPKEISPEHTTMKKSCHDSKLSDHSTATTKTLPTESTKNELGKIPYPHPRPHHLRITNQYIVTAQGVEIKNLTKTRKPTITKNPKQLN